MIGKMLVTSCDLWKKGEIGILMMFFNKKEYDKAIEEKWIEPMEYAESKLMITNKAFGIPIELMKKLGWKKGELLIGVVEEHKSGRKLLKITPFLKDPDKPFI
jgi:hypothetical protein